MRFSNDEIGTLASQYAGPYIGKALALVDAQIRSATRLHNWDEVQKWHQVKLRMKRMRLNETATLG